MVILKTNTCVSKKDFYNIFSKRDQKSIKNLKEKVESIIEEVKNRGDRALIDFTQQFDNVQRKTITLTSKEIKSAESVQESLISILRKAAKNIERFHKQEMKFIKDWTINSDTGRVGQMWNPLQRVGIYIPGGTAAYPSSVLMNVIPAKISGVKEIVLVSPPGRKTGMINPKIVAAAKMLGIKEIYAVGGAQAVAALAFGTETIKPVDKITGPGNAWVAEAKRQVFGRVGIDSIAGPSEILIIADSSGEPDLIAADLLSQAEHDKQAKVFLITDDLKIIKEVQRELSLQILSLPRADIALSALENNGYFVKVESIEEAIEVANFIAPEHLEIQIENYKRYIDKLVTSGALFCGKYSCESVGDYWAGPNHTLPTDLAARFSSALSVRDFIRWTSFIECKRNKLQKVFPQIASFARAEELEAHARAVEKRFLWEKI